MVLYYLLLPDFPLEEDDEDEEPEDLDSLPDEELLPCDAEDSDLDEEELLAGVLTDPDRPEFEPEDTDDLPVAGADCC